VVQVEPPVAGLAVVVPDETSDALTYRPRVTVIVENQDSFLGQDVANCADGLLAQPVLRIPEETERGHELDRLDRRGITGQIPQEERGSRALESGLRQHLFGNVHAIRLNGERRHDLGDATSPASEVQIPRNPPRKESGDRLKQKGPFPDSEEGVERVTRERYIVVGTPVQMGASIIRACSAVLDRYHDAPSGVYG